MDFIEHVLTVLLSFRELHLDQGGETRGADYCPVYPKSCFVEEKPIIGRVAQTAVVL